MTLQTERLRTMEQLSAFVEGAEAVDYQPKGSCGGLRAGAADAGPTCHAAPTRSWCDARAAFRLAMLDGLPPAASMGGAQFV